MFVHKSQLYQGFTDKFLNFTIIKLLKINRYEYNFRYPRKTNF